MIFTYTGIGKGSEKRNGEIEAVNMDLAVSALQQRGIIVSSIKPQDGDSWMNNISLFGKHVKNRDIVILSRQISTLFSAQVPALQIFKLLAVEAEKQSVQKVLSQVADEVQAGGSISKAMGNQPEVFSEFYVNMVKAGEESGKLDDTFKYLADYLERSYRLTSKAKNALIYPAFVIVTFIAVMVLMLTKVIPSMGAILAESGQDVPIYTKIVLGLSSFMVSYGVFFLIIVVILAFLLWRFNKTEKGKLAISRARLSIPYVGSLYKKLFLARLSGNFSMMLGSAIPIVKAIEITSKVVDDAIYEEALREVAENVRGGGSLAQAMASNENMPKMLIQMVRVGEESGELSEILKSLSRFYENEVSDAIETLVSLIEPVMIVFLGLGVGFLLASVLIPIYNISTGV